MPRIIPSIPIDFDGVRHLRFDRRAVFQSEIALTQLWGKPMTFYEAIYALANVFGDTAMALSLNNLSVLLWQGLLHESPSLTLDEVQDALPFDDPAALFPLAGKVLEAWQAMSVPPAEAMPTEVSDADPFGTIDWGSLWAYERLNLGLSEEEFWELTFREAAWLHEQYRRQQERLDRRAAFPGWLLANINRDSKTRPEAFTLEEVVAWLGHGFSQPATAPEPPTPEELHDRLALLAEYYSAGSNGIRGEDG